MSDIGGAALAGGISGAGRGLGNFISKYREQRKADKQSDAAFDAVGSVMGHLEESGVLPKGIAAKYLEAGKGTPEQKRGFLQGIGQVMQFVEQATTRQAREAEAKARGEDRLADNARADAFLKLQEGAADERGAMESGTRGLRGDVAKYLQPGVASVNAGPYSLGLPVMRQLTPEVLAKYSAQRGVPIPQDYLDVVKGPRSSALTPGAADLLESFDIGGVQGVLNKKTGAVLQRSGNAAGLTVEPWMTGENRDEFMANLQDLPIKQAKEVLQIRRQARPGEFRTGNSMDALLAGLLRERTGKDGQDEAQGTPEGTGTEVRRRKFNPKTGKLE